MAGNKRKAPDDAAELNSRHGSPTRLAEPATDKGTTAGELKPVRTGCPPSPGVSADDYFRQLYATEPDFRQLARRDREFAAV